MNVKETDSEDSDNGDQDSDGDSIMSSDTEYKSDSDECRLVIL